MKILTCNIRYFGAADGNNGWKHRRQLCADVIRSRSPDIVCFQEMWAEQYRDLAAAFPGLQSYAMVGEPVGRHPTNCIFYRADGYERVSAGGYWLSDSPHVTGSKSWESACVRLANWVRLAERETGTEFRVINTHLDHVSQTARENQAKLIVEDTAAYPTEYPQILTGDMNCDCTNKAIAVFKACGWLDTYAQIHGTEDPGFTYHEFGGPGYSSECGKMDWIFAKGTVETVDAEIITDSLNGRFPSDHYFVGAELRIGEQDKRGAS
ncbi:endonuclease/exonuclease/phosphatase family protein [Verrucomicrobiota bacterium]